MFLLAISCTFFQFPVAFKVKEEKPDDPEPEIEEAVHDEGIEEMDIVRLNLI